MKEWMINNRYLIMDKIGEGGFATVYKAWDNMLQKFVAIKKIHKEYSSDAKFVDMFKSEAVNTAKLEHENIVRVINFIRDAENNYYIIMDFVWGVDLEYLMNKCPEYNMKITPDISMFIIGEVLKALDYAHSVKSEVTGEPMNMVHRDISPGNIMLYYNGRIKLTDFGIAKAGDARSKRTKKEKLTGKISYMSPEQATGEIDLDGRSDLFSCGVVLYEMLTGEKAFKGDTEVDVWKKVKKARIDFKKLKMYQIPDAIQEILKKVLHRNPDKRYKNAAAMFIDIKKYLSKKGKTDYLREEYEDFVTDALEEEIVKAKKKREQESKRNFREVAEEASLKGQVQTQQPTQPKKETPSAEKQQAHESSEDKSEKPSTDQSGAQQPPQSPPQAIDSPSSAPPPSPAPEPDSSSGGEKDKTVIDFVLDSAQKYRKIFITSLLSLLLAGVIFMAVDTYYQLTDWGIKIHNTIWPPALQLDSLPSEARIEILEDGESILPVKEMETPLSLEEIRPGLYTLKLEKPGFGVIERNITVYEGAPGDQHISIPGSKVVDGVHIVPFEIGVKIDSIPRSSDLFINGRKVGQTPFNDSLELGVYSFKLTKEGFETIGTDEISDSFEKGDCVVDIMDPDGSQTNIDRRFWDMEQREEAGERTLVFTGKLWKNFSITSRPSGAQVYINDTNDPYGQTPLDDLALTGGTHTVRIAHAGYQAWTGTVKVDEESSDELNVSLRKRITVSAYESGNPSKSINVNVRIPGTGINRETPFDVVLPARRHAFEFQADSRYQAKTVTRDVGRLRQRLNVGLELHPPHMEVKVTNFKTGDNIQDASVWIDGEYWKRTSRLGLASGYIESGPGTYRVEIRSNEYGEDRTEITVDPGDRKNLEVVLGTPRDATVVVDTTDITYESRIYLNNEYMGNAFQQMSEIARGTHRIKVDMDDYPQDIEKSINIDQPDELVIINLVERNGEYYLEVQDPDLY